MSTWHVTNLGDAMLADQEVERIKAAFLRAQTTSASPEKMAVFIRHESEGRLHCEVKLYFSPAAADVAIENGGEPCSCPSQDSLGLLVGSEEAWHLLFPEHGKQHGVQED